jgi:hypothetical protein
LRIVTFDPKLAAFTDPVRLQAPYLTESERKRWFKD